MVTIYLRETFLSVVLDICFNGREVSKGFIYPSEVFLTKEIIGFCYIFSCYLAVREAYLCLVTVLHLFTV